MKKKILLTTLLLFIGYIIYQVYVFFLAPVNNIQSIYLIPKDAVFIAETQKPIDNWDKINQSETWKHLQKNNYFNDLTKSLNGLDGVFNKNKKLIDFIGNRSLLISAHVYKLKNYEFFYVTDLKKISKLEVLKNYINSFVNENYKVSSRKYHNHKITEIYSIKDKETLYISFIKNQLIASYVHSLVEASIDQYNEPNIGRNLNFIEIHKKVGYDKMFRFYIQYAYLNDYIKCFSDKPNSIVNNIQETLIFSGFNFNLQRNNIILANGYTNTNEDTSNYLKALQKSGKGTRTIAKVAPKRTAIYMSYAFDSFKTFYSNFEAIQKKNPTQFKKYQDNLDKIENFLKINIKKHFISWIADEVAILQLQPRYTNKKNEIALVIKATDSKFAKENLDLIIKQIKKKTPVKFKQLNYKNHEIQFLSIKGFFKIFMGDLFKKFEKPYFTIIDDYVIFSNHPNTLKSIIDDYVGKETLTKSEDFQDFNQYFDSKSSVFGYINTPVLYDNIISLADKKTKEQIIKNKDFIICFPQIGFQLTPYINMFESKLVVSYQDPEIVKSKSQFKDQILIGPNTSTSSNTTTQSNILEIPIVNLFKVNPIYPNDLNQEKFITKYADGTINTEVEMKDGVRHGKFRAYHPNGEIKLKGRFKKGKQDKTWRAYDSNGNLLDKKRF